MQTRCICATTCTFGWQRCVVNSIYRWSGVLICHPPTISLRSDSDTIDHEKLLMNITDIDLTYNMKRKVITKISSSSLINCSGLLWRRHAGAHLDGHQHRTNKNMLPGFGTKAWIDSSYYSFKIFPRFWLAKSIRLIHHNQLLMTKFGRSLTLTRKWRQKCSVFAG